MNPIDQLFQQAASLQQTGQIDEAEGLYRSILEAQPTHADANYNLGILSIAKARFDAALSFFSTALEARPDIEAFWLTYLSVLIDCGHADIARNVLRLGIEHGLRGAQVDEIAGRLKEMAAPPPAAGRTAPDKAEIAELIALSNQARYRELEALARDLVRQYPAHGYAFKALALALRQNGRLDEAIVAVREAIRRAPGDPEAHNNLGNLLSERRQPAEAEASYRQAIAIASNYLEAHCNLGALLRKQGRLADAEECYRKVLAIAPNHPLTHNNLGNLLKDRGRHSEAIRHYRCALNTQGNYTEAHSNLLFLLNYLGDGEIDRRTKLEEARRYDQTVSALAGEPYRQWACAAAPEALRIGLVSGDLSKHPVGYFLQSLLGAIDPARLQLFAYPTSAIEDELTAAIKPHFRQWSPLFGLADREAARRIHADAIDILIDLSGHTAHNRLPLFAWKAAPIQVSWLGYFATTGVSAIDYILTDETSVPREQQAQFTETVCYLPDTRLCFSPPENAPEVSPPPASANGFVTFGCFQNLAKISDPALALWAKILERLPDTRLRIQNRAFGQPAIRQDFLSRASKQGIDPARLELHGPVSRSEYLQAHAAVDMLLDTFPYPGGATTCEALWMGVPTLTLAGDTMLSRQGASLNTAAGLEHWVAVSEADYLAKALKFAGERQRLAELRRRLREQAGNSPLFDARRFARNFEAAMWRLRENASKPSRQ